jgi:hypothetical protein
MEVNTQVGPILKEKGIIFNFSVGYMFLFSKIESLVTYFFFNRGSVDYKKKQSCVLEKYIMNLCKWLGELSMVV